MPRTAALLLALFIALTPAAAMPAGKAPATLGICPAASGRLDSYIQALCDGEAALQAGASAQAIERFRFAAALPRIDATNELAWAGLAAAHCSARDFDSARPWQGHFAQAKQLWLGQLDCEAAEGDTRSRLSPFVRSRMCSDTLAADYALLRADPSAAHTVDLKARLDQVADALASSCSASVVPSRTGAAAPDKTAPAKKAKAKKKRAPRKPAAVKSKAPRSKRNG